MLSAITALKTKEAESKTAVRDQLDRTHRAVERRQRTVMFCDLVGSTDPPNRLDPEGPRGAMRSYHDAVHAAVTPRDPEVFQGFPAMHANTYCKRPP